MVNQVAVTSRSFSKHLVLRNELLKLFSNVKFNDEGRSLSGEELVEFLAGCDRAIIGLEKIDKTLLEQLPCLKLISKVGVGTDNICFDALKKFNVDFSSTPGTNSRAVSELVLSFMIMLLRHVPQANKLLLSGGWRQFKGRQLAGANIGIVGFGSVGRDLASLLEKMGCHHIYAYEVNRVESYSGKVEFLSLNELLKISDVVSLHVPFTEENHHLLDKQKLSLMKASAVLINVARGGLVDEVALKEALKNKTLTAAAFDVFENEPTIDTELLNLTNFFSTPHIGGSTEEAILNMGMAAINKVSCV